MEYQEVNTKPVEEVRDMTPTLHFRLIRCTAEQLDKNRRELIPDVWAAETPVGLLLSSSRRSLALLPGVKFDDLRPGASE